MHASNPRVDTQDVYSSFRAVIPLRAFIPEVNIAVKIRCSKFHGNAGKINTSVSKRIFSFRCGGANVNTVHFLEL